MGASGWAKRLYSADARQLLRGCQGLARVVKSQVSEFIE